MDIQFLGATKTVTGSKYLLSTANTKVLIDCGIFQGLKELRLRNWTHFPIAPASINVVVLTHAHLDHSGYLPLLIKNGFHGKIYCTQATKDLCAILLPDSGHLQEEEANRANRHGYSKHKPALPLYTRADAEAIMSRFHVVNMHDNFTIGDIHFCLHGAGHILGAATVFAKADNTSILFSGDLGRQRDPCMYPPEVITQANNLVIESTYGDRLHENVDPKEELAVVINRVAERGGTIIIPAFAVGRTQTILYYIYQLLQAKRIPKIPVFLDSPMAQEATAIMLQYAKDHRLPKDDYGAACHVARYVTSVDESKEIDAYNYPKIIISASGMATGGRVLHHIKAFASDSRNLILFVGYQAAGTRGEVLLSGHRQIKMLGEEITVNAEVKALNNMSAHVDYEEMLNWLQGMKANAPRKVFITHGEERAALALQAKIHETLGWNCVVPEYLQREIL